MDWNQIEWIFFDVGNVILNDDPAMAVVYEHVYKAIQAKHPDVTEAFFFSERERLINESRDFAPFVTLAKKYLDEEGFNRTQRAYRKSVFSRWQELCPVIQDMPDIVKRCTAHKNVGLICDQPPEVKPLLENLGIWECVKVHGISAFVNMRKPNVKFYQWALDKAGCRPEQAIMIGDRIDNDIRPAKSLGMRTAWLQWPLHEKNMPLDTPWYELYFASMQRAYSNAIIPAEETDMPDLRIGSRKELGEALKDFL